MRAIAAALAVLLLAGCSAGEEKATHPTAPKSSAFRATVGQDAAAIAQHITGCGGVASGSTGEGGPSMASTATCTLSGHLVILDSWASASDAAVSPGLAGSELYYATGAGWTAFLADQGATAETTTLQMQLTNDAGGLFKQAVDQSALPPASVDAQKTLSAQIAHALGGQVAHVA